MRGRGITVIFAALVAFGFAAAGCGGTNEGEAGASAWADVAATFEPGVDPASANPCTRGDRGCLDLVRGEMKRRSLRRNSTAPTRNMRMRGAGRSNR